MHFPFSIFNFPSFCFPRYCISCGSEGDYLCTKCKRNVIPHPEICPLCHRFSADYQTCINCRTDRSWYLEGIIIPFSYSNEIKKLILRLKYYHKKDVVDFLTDRLILAIQTNKKIPSSSTFNYPFSISFVPSHRYRKYFTKGYNQSELLAKSVAKKLGICCQSLVKKTKHTKTQAGLDRKSRLVNLTNAFSLKSNNLKGDETVVLIDDVTTTGSTLNQIAKTIKKIYPKVKIWGIVIARHNG